MSTSISFCLPVYNVKEYIEDCIISIIDADIRDSEIICIDDCSTDGSDLVLAGLAQKYPQIKVIRNQINKGVSCARNMAIHVAQGEYIWFVDPDDLLVPSITAKVLSIAIENKADAVFGRCFYFMNGSTPNVLNEEPIKVEIADFKKPSSYYQKDQNGTLSFGIWSGPFKLSSLIDNKIEFCEGMTHVEDAAFLFEFGIKNKNILAINQFSYCYRIRIGSASHNDKSGRIQKKYYENSKRLLQIYSRYYQSNEEFTESITAHMQDRVEAATYYLARTPDNEYVKKEINFLIQEGWYPYKHNYQNELRKRKKKILFKYILPQKIWFWAYHYLYCASHYHNS